MPALIFKYLVHSKSCSLFKSKTKIFENGIFFNILSIKCILQGIQPTHRCFEYKRIQSKVKV